MTIVSLSELRANMASYFDKVADDRDELVVTRRNHEPLVVLPLSELEGLRETLYLLGNPVNAQILLDSVAELDAGKGVEHELIDL